MSDTLAVEVRRLSKSFGRTWALRTVDLDIHAGERVALLGPNGAGKSTLMRLLATLTRPTLGEVEVYGLNTVRDTARVRRVIGVVAHRPYLYEDLTARENLEFYAQLYGLSDPQTRYLPLLDLAGLSHVSGSRVRTYSRGMQQRLALVRSLLHEPRLLLLDEPDTGLDQEALAMLERIIRTDSEERTVLFSTHNHELGMRLADRVVVLADGGVVYDAPSLALDPSHFRARYTEIAGARA